MNSKLMLKLIISGTVVGSLVSCGETRVASGGGNSSEVTSVNITLPDRGVLKSQVADIETKMNAYRIVIKSTGGGCTDPTNIDKIDLFSNNPSLAANLQQGCDYQLSLELGNRGSSTTTPSGATSDKVTYDGKVKAYLDSACITCHSATASISNLTSWATVKSNAQGIYDRVVVQGDMPKGKTPSSTDKDMITAWKNAGFLEKAESSQTTTGTSEQLTAVYYKNTSAHVINKADIQGQAAYKVNLKLQLQQAGKDIGLGGSIQQPATGGGLPETLTKPFTLTGERNLYLANNSGTKSLNDLIKGKKLVIDVSTTNCGYCISEAKELNNSPSLQASLDDSKCSYVTVTSNKNDLSGWNGQFSGSYVGNRSYYLTANPSGGSAPSLSDVFRRIFPTQSAGTPTFIVISADGKVDKYANGLKEVIGLCQ